MATSWVVVVLVLGLACLGRPAMGQFSPEVDKIIRGKKAVFDGVQRMNEMLSGKNVDADQLHGLISERWDIQTKLEQKMRDLLSGHMDSVNVWMSQSGERFYAISSQTHNNNEANTGGGRALVSEQCAVAVLQYYQDLVDDLYYARRMDASRGRPQFRNILYTGNIKDYGNVWLCTSTKANITSGVPSFNGKYCFADPKQPYDLVGWGTCWPDTCTQEDVNGVTAFFWSEILGIEPFIYYDCTEPSSWSTAEIGFLTTLSLFVFLVLCGSFYDVFLQEHALQKTHTSNTNRPSVHEKVVGNVFENQAATDDQEGSDITESSAEDDATEEVVDDEQKKRGASADDGSTSWGKVTELKLDYSRPPGEDGDMIKELHKESRTHRKNGTSDIVRATLTSFSVVTNCRKLLSTKKTKDALAVLNGLRVLSMWWVILGHSALYYSGRILNPYQALSYFEKYGSYAIANATYSVDTFFVLSGFLVTHFSLKQIDCGKLKSAGNWAMFYFHRWWRLTPVYMVAMGIWALLTPHFGQGILPDEQFEFVRHYCRLQWWTHPLYINNLYPWPNVYDNSCMRWSWYLANDMQFYVISPMILVVLYRNGKAGLALISSIMLVSLASLFGITWYYGYNVSGMEPYNDHVPEPANADTYYAKPYTRIPPYLAGMILGYIMFKLRGKKVKLPMSVVFLGWLCALAILWIVIYGPWYPNGEPTPQIVSVLYLTFSRLGWGVGICWVIFACLQGYGGPIGALLDWSFWIPLARLTYCAYLIHPIIIYTKTFTDEVLFQFTYVTLAYLYVGNIVFSYTASLILSLVIEGPFVGLEKVIFGKSSRS